VKVENKTPISIEENTFPNRQEATLCVPAGCKLTYQHAEYWEQFKSIVEIGDVNGDGEITPSDAIMILYAYFGVNQVGFNSAAADLNGDEEVTPADAIETLYLYFGVHSETNYYWYVGQTNPSTMTSISPIVTDMESPGWRLIGTTLPTYSSSNMLWNSNNVITTGSSLAKQYVAIPAESSACPRDGVGNDASTVDMYTRLSDITISGISYKVYETVGKSRKYGLDTY
jgi:hypothetical protein